MNEGKIYDFKIRYFDEKHFQIVHYQAPHRYDYKKSKNNLEKTETNNCSLNDIISGIKKSIATSRNRAKNKIYDLARSNDFDIFVTLTFNPELVDSYNYDECTKKLSKWLNNLKSRYAPDLRYIMVPELHKSGRYHFHGLFGNIGNIILSDSGKKTPSGEPIYNIDNYKFGFTTATYIKDKQRVSTYIGKYITKDLSGHIKDKKHYWASRNLNTPYEQMLTYVDLYNMGLNKEFLENNSIYEKSVKYNLYGEDVTVTYYEFELK